jgi:hypothetical protein
MLLVRLLLVTVDDDEGACAAARSESAVRNTATDPIVLSLCLRVHIPQVLLRMLLGLRLRRIRVGKAGRATPAAVAAFLLRSSSHRPFRGTLGGTPPPLLVCVL